MTQKFGTLFYVIVFAVLAPLLHLVLGLALDRVVGESALLTSVWFPAAGIVITGAGLSVLAASIIQLRTIGRGLPVSSSPPSRLVVTGPYRLSRHPIYLGGVLTFLGFAMIIDSFWSAVLVTPVMGYFYFTYAAGVEEPVLISRFGDEYRQYRARTPLVLPFPLWRPLRNTISQILDRTSTRRRGDRRFFPGYGLCTGAGVIVGLAVFEFLLQSQGIRTAEGMTYGSPLLLLDAVLPSLMIALAITGTCRVVGTGPDDPGSSGPARILPAIHRGVTGLLVIGLWYRYSLPLLVPASIVIALTGFLGLGDGWLRTQKKQVIGPVSTRHIVSAIVAVSGVTLLFLIGSGPGIAAYTALGTVELPDVTSRMHPLLILALGAMATLAFGYRHGRTE